MVFAECTATLLLKELIQENGNDFIYWGFKVWLTLHTATPKAISFPN